MSLSISLRPCVFAWVIKKSRKAAEPQSLKIAKSRFLEFKDQ